MGKKIYINGGILVKTRLFTCRNAVCLCEDIPEGAIVIDPPIYDGSKCLVIDDEHPQSLFNEYYCKTFFSSLYYGIDYLSYSSNECFEEFEAAITESRLLLEVSVENDLQWTFYKMIYLHTISCLDAFICSLILSKISHDEELFSKYYAKMFSSSKKLKLDPLINSDHTKWEHEVLIEILHTSFCNVKTIKDCFRILGLSSPIRYYDIIMDHFKKRHLLMHRNGRMLEGKRMELNREIVSSATNDIFDYGKYLLFCFNSPRIING